MNYVKILERITSEKDEDAKIKLIETTMKQYSKKEYLSELRIDQHKQFISDLQGIRKKIKRRNIQNGVLALVLVFGFFYFYFFVRDNWFPSARSGAVQE
jgi:hypothetical protein